MLPTGGIVGPFMLRETPPPAGIGDTPRVRRRRYARLPAFGRTAPAFTNFCIGYRHVIGDKGEMGDDDHDAENMVLNTDGKDAVADTAGAGSEAASPQLRIVVLSPHVYMPGGRKASVHFVAENWARMGHAVSFTTVGYSWLNIFRRWDRFNALRREQRNRYKRFVDNLDAGGYLPLAHGFSTRNPFLQRASDLLLKGYGQHLPSAMEERIAEADLIVLESGSPLLFADLVHRLNPEATKLYFCRDLLRSVGASPRLQDIERRLIGTFDVTCVPSRRLGESLPAGGRVAFVPQGLDKDVFDAATRSPYAAGSVNAVAAGDMLFDRDAVASMAAAAPGVTFHLFGVGWQGTELANIRLHGEMGFAELAAYIRHADFGIAAYRYSEREAYLAESSLKLLQYAYCGLPTVLPDSLPVNRGNEVGYRLDGDNDWAAIIDEALAMRRSGITIRQSVPSWDEVARMVLDTVPASRPVRS